MMRMSQHRERQQPPAGQAPLIAAIVTKGEQYRRARNTLDVTQKSRYLQGATHTCPCLTGQTCKCMSTCYSGRDILHWQASAAASSEACLVIDVAGAYSSLMSLPAVKTSRFRPEANTTPLTLCRAGAQYHGTAACTSNKSSLQRLAHVPKGANGLFSIMGKSSQ